MPGGRGLRVRKPEQEGLTAVVMTGAGTGDVAVVIVDPQGRRDTVEVALEDKGDSTFRCTYRPVMEGPHTVHVAFAGAPITRSPFPVHVAEGKGRSATLLRAPPKLTFRPDGDQLDPFAGDEVQCLVHVVDFVHSHLAPLWLR